MTWAGSFPGSRVLESSSSIKMGIIIGCSHKLCRMNEFILLKPTEQCLVHKFSLNIIIPSSLYVIMAFLVLFNHFKYLLAPSEIVKSSHEESGLILHFLLTFSSHTCAYNSSPIHETNTVLHKESRWNRSKELKRKYRLISQMVFSYES